MTFETFFNEHYEPVRRSLAVAFGDPVLAEELAQDAFARALASWRRVSKMDHAAGWVYVVALRAGRRRPNRAQPAVTVEPVDADVADTVTRDVVLSAAIA